MRRVLILSGEASGDLHGASLAEELRNQCPDITLEGIGGPRMVAAGVRMIESIERLDIIGIPTISELNRAISVYRKLSRYIRSNRFDVVVFIDNPGLNLRLARVAKESGHRTIYYIAPQIWAWNEARIQKLQKYVDKLLVILPFEEDYFRKAGIDCKFVGHPIIENLKTQYDSAALRQEFEIRENVKVIGLLPGSRKSEVQRLLPIMIEAAQLICQRNSMAQSNYEFVLAQASSIPNKLIAEFLKYSKIPIRVIRDRSLETIALCDAVLVASGTATMQTALIGKPMAIVYRVSKLTYQISKRLIKVRWIGLANLIAGRQIANELIQDQLTPDNLAREAVSLLDPAKARDAVEISHELRRTFGSSRASVRAATEIVNLISANE